MRCGTCKYWSTTMVRNHGSYIYGHCLNKKADHNDLTEYDDYCEKHSQNQLNSMEKRAVVSEKDNEPSTIVKEAMEKIIKEENKQQKEKQFVLGADPGKHGAIVLINAADLSDQIHIPTKVKDGRIDTLHWYNSILPYKDNIVVAVKEEIHAIFGSSAASTFEFGASDGMLEAFLQLLSNNKFEVYKVQPKNWQACAWKKVDKINGDPIIDKETGLQKVNKDGEPRFKTDTKATSASAAHKLFPNVSFVPKRCRNEHDGVIDAALIAYYGICKYARK